MAASSAPRAMRPPDRKSTRLNSSHDQISYAVFCLKKKKTRHRGPVRGLGEGARRVQAYGHVLHRARRRSAVLAIAEDCFFFNDTATTEIYTLSLHDALPI